MSYHLGIDIGDSRVHAVTARVSPSGSVVAEPLSLGAVAVGMPAVMWVASDGACTFGDAAQSRSQEQPERLISRIRPRVGTGVPFIVDTYQFSGEDAYARLAATVVDTVVESEGRRPDRVVLTHPDSWGEHRVELIRSALLRHCDVDVDLLPEPQAVARGLVDPLEPGQLVAVFDLGGTALDISVLRADDDGGEVATVWSEAIPFGGIDIDDVIVAGVRASTPELSNVPRGSLAVLRPASLKAKEELSSQYAATISTQDLDGSTAVRLTRNEFEVMIHGLLDRTVSALNETLDSSGVSIDEVSTVILAGGSSRIPGVAQYISTSLGRPVLSSPDPDLLIAAGAARSGLAESDGATVQRLEISDGDESGENVDDVESLLQFIPPNRARLATVAWRVALGALIVVAAAYLVLTLGPELSGVFGASWMPGWESGNGVVGVVQ